MSISTTTIAVDRVSILKLPFYMKGLERHDLMFTGPTKYNLLSEAYAWLFEGQEEGTVLGDNIYSFLKDSNSLPSCAGFADLLAITKSITPDVFRRLYGEKAAIFAWRSVGRTYEDGLLRVPYVSETTIKTGNPPFWAYLSSYFSRDCPALRFKNVE